ncbi:MAG: lamin tail domain-containing protein [Deltaproteobacteria bacterium]|nr:lamin tail domain-containing protein [Deltaproteobacteria bacterium]
MRYASLLALTSTFMLLAVACAQAGSGDSDGADGGDDLDALQTAVGVGGGGAVSSSSAVTVGGSGTGGSTVTVGATSGSGGATVTVGVATVSVAASTVASTSASTAAVTVGVGSASSSSTGSGGGFPTPACDHDVCTEGGPLKPSCDGCSSSVCAADAYCCNNAWDQICIGATAKHCPSDPCGLVGSSSASSSSSGGGGGGILPGDLLITEIMNNPAKVLDTKGEWFEIRNTTKAPIDLMGLVIRHQLVSVDPKAVEAVAKSVIVPAGSYVVLGNNGDFATNGGVKVDYVYSSKVVLNNTKDHVALETADVPAVTIDASTYDTAKLDVSGKSRSLDPSVMTMSGNDDDTNFCAAKTLIAGSTDTGTPGKLNDSCK